MLMKSLLVSLVALLGWFAQADEGIQVHGSGTTNPSKCYWLIMDLIMDRIKLPTRLTYRAVGSSTGQKEFIGSLEGTTGADFTPANDFGSGDIPISTDDYTALTGAGVEFVHLPIVLGAISLFHSVPNVSTEPGQGLNLTACVIARIFKGEITTWDNEDVVAMNPNLNLPSADYPITVARRVLGSSSTASVTQYLHQTCPGEWPEDLVGKTIEWPESTKPCEGSGGMTECIKGTPGTIGYIDAGHGHTEKLNEIELQNKAGTYLSSKEASAKGGIAAAATAVPESADMDFGDVNLLNQDGEFTWPIVAMSYVYVRKNLNFIDDVQEQTLLKAFLTALYDPDYINECVERFAFTAVPEEVRQIGLDGIAMLTTSGGNGTEWVFEKSTTPGEGQGPYVISHKRRSYGEYQRNLFDGDSTHLQTEIDNLRIELANEKSKVSSLETEISAVREQLGGDANTPITATSAEYAEFTEDDAGKISASLIMSSISLVLWAVAAALVAYRHLHRPNKDIMGGPEHANGTMNGGSGHGINGGSGHGSRSTAAKHSAVTQGNDLVA